MDQPLGRHVIAATTILALAGCASPQEAPKATPAATTDPLMGSAKKIQQDFSQTETDLGDLESQVKLARQAQGDAGARK